MSIDASLTKLMPGLSAQERAILILGAFKSKTPEDPNWRITMPPHQSPELSRLVGLVNACGLQVASLIVSIKKEVEKLELHVLHLDTLLRWDLHVAEIDQAAQFAREPVTAGADQADLDLLLEKPYKLSEERVALSTVIEGLVTELQAHVQVFWEDARAIEIVLDEVAAEFGGEDPLRARFRELLDKMKAGLTHLNGVLEVMDAAAELQEPDEDNLADLRALVERAASSS